MISLGTKGKSTFELGYPESRPVSQQPRSNFLSPLFRGYLENSESQSLALEPPPSESPGV